MSTAGSAALVLPSSLYIVLALAGLALTWFLTRSLARALPGGRDGLKASVPGPE